MPLGRGWGRTKPPPGLPVDWGHPLADRLGALWLCNEGAGGRLDDAARGPTASTQLLGPTVRWEAGPTGAVVRFDGTSGQAPAFTGPDIASKPFSLLLRYTVYDARETEPLRIGSQSDTRKALHLRDQSSATFQFNMFNDDAAFSYPARVGAEREFLVTLDEAFVGRVYLDGAFLGSDPYAGFFVGNTDYTIGAFGGNNYVGSVTRCAVWPNRVLTGDDAAALAAAPYDLIWSPGWRRWFVPAAPAPGGYTPRLALLGVG